MEEYRYPLSGTESVYIVTSGAEVVEAKLYACGVLIGEMRKSAHRVPESVVNTVASSIPGGTIIDLLHGEPIHLGVSKFASFSLIIKSATIPSVTLFPAESSPTGPVVVSMVGSNKLVYTIDGCCYETIQ